VESEPVLLEISLPEIVLVGVAEAVAAALHQDKVALLVRMAVVLTLEPE
jgi:hypothetical protein